MKTHFFAPCALLIFLGLAQISYSQSPKAAAAGAHHKIQVHEPALAQAMAAAGARLIADYGAYQLYDAPGAATNLPADKIELRDDYNSIFLNARRLDTSAPEVQALRKTAGQFAGKRLHLVHFAGPVQTAWRKSLLDAGVQIVTYIPQNAYLVYGDSASLARLQTLAASAPHFQWEGAYLDDYKIHPAARAAGAASHQFDIQLVADAPANADTLKLLDQLKLAPLARQRSVLQYLNLVARLSPADLGRIAARPDVVSIQPYGPPRKWGERQDQIVAGNLSGTVPSGPGYLAFLQKAGFTQAQFDASGFAVDVTDSGIDDGTTSPNHFGLYAGGRTTNASRVIYNRLEGEPNSGSSLAGWDGHGNINAHIIGGYDNSSGFPFEDSSGYHYGLGVCPFVRLGSSVIFDPYLPTTDPVYSDITSQAYADGARICNNSWGDGGSDGLYNSDSQEYDALVRDAQPDGSADAAAGNQELVIVFAAGNDGPGAQTVSAPGTAKNVITVGAAENVQIFGGAYDGADLGDNTDSDADNANAMLDWSGSGPCSDGRQKPDLVAPATHVSGGAPQAANPGPDGTADSHFLDDSTNYNDSSVINLIEVDGGSDGSYFFPDTGQQFYTASSGTSHSTPCVSGGCALLRQFFINNSWSPPSPAMTKAFLMNSARYLTGAYADDTLWSSTQGMGEMNLGTAFDGTPRLLCDELPADLFTASGQTRTFTGMVGTSSKPFRVTVAWTDAPGSTTGAAYNNDLDLTVTVAGKTYKGNVFSGAYSTTGGTADAVNNVESVFLPAGVSGPYTVTISATSINSMGVPNDAGEVNQDFALVIYNTGSGPSLTPAGSLLISESCLPTNGVVDPGETVKVNLALQNVGLAATTDLVATLLASNGVALPSAAQTYGALAPGATASAAFSFTAEGVCGGSVAALLQLQDGNASLGTVNYTFPLGRLVTDTNSAQTFDTVSPPALPSGWTSTDAKSLGVAWTTESGVSDNGANAVYCPDSAFVDEVTLVSPAIQLSNAPSQLSFRQSFNLEDGYDGGVLDINIGASGAFEDIVAAGGSFVTGGYTGSIQTESPGADEDPLALRNAWTGTTSGFISTVINLPAAAQGKSIQLEWICGTDYGNELLTGVGGWWIDNLLVSQTNYVCCSSGVTVSFILSPTNGYQTTNTALVVSGIAAPDAPVTVYNNGASNTTVTAKSTGAFSASLTLPYGTNQLAVEAQGQLNTNDMVTVLVVPRPPTLKAATKPGPAVAISGVGLPGAVIDLYSSGVLLTNFTVTAAGAYAGSIVLPGGSYSLTATQSTNGLTSISSAAVAVTTVPAPVILFPPTGFSSNNPSLKVTGTGVSGAEVSVYDGAKLLGAATAAKTGGFSLIVKLNNGTNMLTATQTQGGVASLPGAEVTVTMILSPAILTQPRNITGFLKETVQFTSAAAGFPPLRYYWEKNGAKISGAISSNLTLYGLTATSAGSYQVIATNIYSAATSVVAVLNLVPNPFTNLAGTYYGLFAESPPQFQSSGLLTLKLSSLGTFSASMLNAGGTYSFTGVFSLQGVAQTNVSRGKGVASMSLDLNLDVSTNDTQQILGTVFTTNWSASLQADLATFTLSHPSPDAGKYTMLFEGTNDGSTGPGGDGYATVTVSPAGMVSLTGVLSDNTSVAPSAVSVSKYGQWPLYIPLYGKLGSLLGRIDFTNTGASSFAGGVSWFRTNAYGALYKHGFTNSALAVGSTFIPGTAKIPALGLTNLTVTLSGGGLPAPLTNDVTLYNTGRFVTNGPGISRLSLSLTPSTGVLAGTFLDPATKLSTTIKGVVFQRQTNAGGFFLSTNATGYLVLTNRP
ncbi:MAG: S8 family serine peptidase [Verrucomicrobiota bacterium]